MSKRISLELYKQDREQNYGFIKINKVNKDKNSFTGWSYNNSSNNTIDNGNHYGPKKPKKSHKNHNYDNNYDNTDIMVKPLYDEVIVYNDTVTFTQVPINGTVFGGTIDVEYVEFGMNVSDCVTIHKDNTDTTGRRFIIDVEISGEYDGKTARGTYLYSIDKSNGYHNDSDE